MTTPFSQATGKFHKRAQENADYFGVPYVCFFDTSGTYRMERFDPECGAHKLNATLFTPKRYDDSRVKMPGDTP